MRGYVISYKPKDANARTLLNHTLFGRLIYKEVRGKRVAYYSKGIFDDILYVRLMPSKIFISEDSMGKIMDRIVSIKETFGHMLFEEAERDESKLLFKTGKNHWQEIARERGYYVRAFQE